MCRILWYRILYYSVCKRPPLGQINPLHTPPQPEFRISTQVLHISEGTNGSGSMPAYILNPGNRRSLKDSLTFRSLYPLQRTSGTHSGGSCVGCKGVVKVYRPVVTSCSELTARHTEPYVVENRIGRLWVKEMLQHINTHFLTVISEGLFCFLGVTTQCGCIFTAQYRALASSFSRFLDHTQRRATVGRTPLDEWSIRRRDLYLTTQHSQQTNIHAPGGIRTHHLSRRAAADLRLRPHGHWDRQLVKVTQLKYCSVYYVFQKHL